MGSCCSNSVVDFPIHLEDIEAFDDDEETLVQSFQTSILTPSADLLFRFGNYKDANDLIVAAISNNCQENQDAAFNAVIPLIKFQEEIYDYSNKCLDAFKGFIDFFLNSEESLHVLVVRYQKIVKAISQLAEIALKFDEIKLMLPKLLSDISYFRRSSRRPDFTEFEDMYLKSSTLSMFFASLNPFFSKLMEHINKVIEDPSKTHRVLDILATFADMYVSIANSYKDSNQENELLCIKGCVFFIVAFDNVSPVGAFCSKSPIHIENAIRIVVGYQPKQTYLINSLKYSTKHFNEPTTSQIIKDLLE